MAKLTFVLEDGQEIVVPLADHMTFGRWEDNDVVVDDERISKHHAELVHNADGSIQLFDSNSTAGTFVNGERVRSRTILHGDTLAFGPLTAVLDLSDHSANGSSITPALAGDETQAVTIDQPVKAGKIATRKRNRGGRQDSNALKHNELQAAAARLESELDAVQKELREWQDRSAAEHAIHLSRIESLRAEEERLAPIQKAVHEAEAAHGEWLQSIQTLTTQHEQKAADLQRLRQDEAAARHELEGLATHRDQALTHLQQIRAESLRDETVLDMLRRQITELEARGRGKEAMDQLYARLATLPQDSPEARDLWHEIEKEKAGLHELITTARTQAHAGTPEVSRDRTAVSASAAAEGPVKARTSSTVAPGATQETTLRSRLGHLRESVQREESRLEQLHGERTRHESPHRSNLAAEAMMREQSRHLETKIRQEQERHHALLHNIEISQAEEEKRRERLGELERRLAELRADIAEAERQRSELRQQADLAHTELKNFETAIDRMTKISAD